ncbi:unnamed protein product, partial [Rotaria sp. Silwood2]
SSIRYDKSTRATIPDTTSFDITAIDTNIVEDSYYTILRNGHASS